jgi:uncharacterized membrane protein
MEKKVFAFLILISAVLLCFVFIFVSLIFKPNISPAEVGWDNYNQINMANNVLFDVIIPFGCPFLILLPIVIYYTKKNKTINKTENNK